MYSRTMSTPCQGLLLSFTACVEKSRGILALLVATLLTSRQTYRIHGDSLMPYVTNPADDVRIHYESVESHH